MILSKIQIRKVCSIFHSYHSVLYLPLKEYFSMVHTVVKHSLCDHDKTISTTHRDTQILIITHPNKVVNDVTIDN